MNNTRRKKNDYNNKSEEDEEEEKKSVCFRFCVYKGVHLRRRRRVVIPYGYYGLRANLVN